MKTTAELEALRQRRAPLEMEPGEFREIGHRLVDEIASTSTPPSETSKPCPCCCRAWAGRSTRL